MQLAVILSHCNKIKTIDDLLNLLDLILELAREDVYKIAKSKRIIFSDFDFTYNDAVEMLKSQLKKSHLKGIRRFINSENIANAVSWLIRRILANMRNICFSKKYRIFCNPSFTPLHKNIHSNNNFEKIFEIMDLEKLDKNTIKEGLLKLRNNLIFEEDLDYTDLEYLSIKYGFEISEIVGAEAINLQKYKKEQAESGNFQLVFVF